MYDFFFIFFCSVLGFVYKFVLLFRVRRTASMHAARLFSFHFSFLKIIFSLFFIFYKNEKIHCVCSGWYGQATASPLCNLLAFSHCFRQRTSFVFVVVCAQLLWFGSKHCRFVLFNAFLPISLYRTRNYYYEFLHFSLFAVGVLCRLAVAAAADEEEEHESLTFIHLCRCKLHGCNVRTEFGTGSFSVAPHAIRSLATTTIIIEQFVLNGNFSVSRCRRRRCRCEMLSPSCFCLLNALDIYFSIVGSICLSIFATSAIKLGSGVLHRVSFLRPKTTLHRNRVAQVSYVFVSHKINNGEKVRARESEREGEERTINVVSNRQSCVFTRESTIHTERHTGTRNDCSSSQRIIQLVCIFHPVIGKNNRKIGPTTEWMYVQRTLRKTNNS